MRRTRIYLELRDGRRVTGHVARPRWFLRWLFRLSAAGYGPVIDMRDDETETGIEIVPGVISHVQLSREGR